jgi:CRISPR-associated protein Csd1
LQEDPGKRQAYLCGCLLAVLERVQQLAVPSAKATITDRFFGTASSAPASVFGRLLRLCQSHLGKLRKEKPGAHARLQASLEEIQQGLKCFPRTLTLEQQGLFSLGYYHQRAKDRAEAIQRKRARESQQQPSGTNTR